MELTVCCCCTPACTYRQHPGVQSKDVSEAWCKLLHAPAACYNTAYSAHWACSRSACSCMQLLSVGSMRLFGADREAQRPKAHFAACLLNDTCCIATGRWCYSLLSTVHISTSICMAEHAAVLVVYHVQADAACLVFHNWSRLTCPVPKAKFPKSQDLVMLCTYLDKRSKGENSCSSELRVVSVKKALQLRCHSVPQCQCRHLQP